MRITYVNDHENMGIRACVAVTMTEYLKMCNDPVMSRCPVKYREKTNPDTAETFLVVGDSLEAANLLEWLSENVLRCMNTKEMFEPAVSMPLDENIFGYEE